MLAAEEARSALDFGASTTLAWGDSNSVARASIQPGLFAPSTKSGADRATDEEEDAI